MIEVKKAPHLTNQTAVKGKKMNKNALALVGALSNKYGAETPSLTKTQISATAVEIGVPQPSWLFENAKFRLSRGVYKMPTLTAEQQAQATKIARTTVALTPTLVSSNPQVAAPGETPDTSNNVVSLSVESTGFSENLIPEKNPLFSEFGNFASVKKVVKSGMFFPLFITGLSGNGKTFSVEQACAQTKRELIRVNFTIETDEDDLIGGFRLINGDTRYFHGPVIKAMQRGAVLLCDEIDLASPAKVMCLQSILEGKGYFIKKTGEYIKPAPGFTVIATANTKGKGSEDGTFIGTNILNEAFLERFPVTLEQEYPPIVTEKKIIKMLFDSLGIDDDHFANKLVDWADINRKTFREGGIEDVISTRRLVAISNAFAIFGDKVDAIKKCINRFDDDTKTSLLDMYGALDDKVDVNEDTTDEVEDTADTSTEDDSEDGVVSGAFPTT